MPGKKRFESAVAKYSGAIALRAATTDQTATTAWMEGVLLGVENVDRPRARALRRDDRFIVNLLRAFSEVDSASDTLQVISTLARRAPPKSLAVSSDAQLRLFVEAYLSEIYILSLRCDALLTFIERAYRKDSRTKELSSACANIRAEVTASFKVMLAVRGAHVHKFRYDDFDVSRLGTLKIPASTDRVLERIHHRALRDVRRKKIQWMRNNNAAIAELLDRFFDTVFPLVFADDATPRYPSPMRAA